MKPTRYTPELIEKYTQNGNWNLLTLSHYWDINAERYPNQEAIVDSRNRLTWTQAKDWVDRAALSMIELGIGRDEVVAVQLPNFTELCLLRVALEKAGILYSPLLRSLRQTEMEYILRYLDAVAVIIPWRYAGFDHYQMVQDLKRNLPNLKHIIIVDDEVPDKAISLQHLMKKKQLNEETRGFIEARRHKFTEVSLIGHTSGTTGMPKFVEFSPCARLTAGHGIARLLNLNNKDIVAALGPASGGPNNCAYFGAPVAGAKVAMLEVFQAKPALELIHREKATIACVSPAHLAMMLAEPGFNQYDFSSLRYLFSAGAPLPYELGHEVEERFCCPVLNCLGAVDCGGLISTYPDSTQDERLLTVGKPIGYTELKLVNETGQEVPVGEVGEIFLGGPSCAGGYFKDTAATWQAWSKDGWFKMGDLGRLDSRGNLVMVGRKKDMIIRGGQNIYPLEIENLLLAHPKIASAAIVGMPDTVMGEKACAFVVTKPDQVLTFEEMLAFLRKQKIASYKLPERLEIIAEIPLAAEQKPDKKALRAIIAEKLNTEGR